MRLTTLISVILLTTLGLVPNLTGSPQAASNAHIKQAFGAQNWRLTIQAVNQINTSTAPRSNSNSRLTLYQALLSRQ